MFRLCHAFQTNNTRGIRTKNNILNALQTSSLKLRFENWSSLPWRCRIVNSKLMFRFFLHGNDVPPTVVGLPSTPLGW